MSYIHFRCSPRCHALRRRPEHLAFAGLLALLLTTGHSLAQSAPALEHRVDHAVDLGVEYLLSEIQGQLGWTPIEHYPGGYLGVQIYALLESDVSYLHPVVQEGLRKLGEIPRRKVYSVSLALMAYSSVLGQLEEDDHSPATRRLLLARRSPTADRREYQRRARECVDWLLAARVPTRAVWTYERASRRRRPRDAVFDHSNTQFAVLALGLAANRGLDIPRALWQELAEQCVSSQTPTGEAVALRPVFDAGEDTIPSAASEAGRRRDHTRRGLRRDEGFLGERLYNGHAAARARGWGYRDHEPGSRVTFSMTSAMLSCALLAHRQLRIPSRPSAEGARLEGALRDGFAWLCQYLERTGSLRADTYQLYSLEKVGDLGRVASFGGCSWFEAGAEALLAAQGEDGQWGASGSAPSRHKTALALLFFARASRLDAPRRRVTLTGEGESDRAGFARRYLAHVGSLGAAVPLIQFFRRLRYGPTATFLDQSNELLVAYDEDHLDELARFYRTLELSPFPVVTAHGREVLQRCTGEAALSDILTLRWIRRWEAVRAFARGAVPETEVDLRRWLRDSPSRFLRLQILRALRRRAVRDAIPDAIAMLESPDLDLRRSAYDTLVVLSGQRLRFEAEAPAAVRRQQTRRWREWWENEGAGEGEGEP